MSELVARLRSFARGVPCPDVTLTVRSGRTYALEAAEEIDSLSSRLAASEASNETLCDECALLRSRLAAAEEKNRDWLTRWTKLKAAIVMMQTSVVCAHHRAHIKRVDIDFIRQKLIDTYTKLEVEP